MDLRNQSVRAVVLGASGWVGQTAFRVFRSCNSELLLVASSEKLCTIDNHSVLFRSFNSNQIEDFQPTVILDSAFITREKMSHFSYRDYVDTNEMLIERALWAQSLPSVEMFIGISSGAAKPFLVNNPPDAKDDTYGWLKAKYESRLLENARLRERTKIARIWSVSGDLVTKPSIFAFSNFIQQALEGKIRISSNQNVWRRYVDIEDFLHVVLMAEPDGTRVIDSGGDLLEIGQLAEMVFEVLGKSPNIKRSLNETLAPDLYFSDNLSWGNAIDQIAYHPRTIREQISRVARSLSN